MNRLQNLHTLSTYCDGISELSALGFVSSLATSMTTPGCMDDMDQKGIMLNSAFAVSAAFTFAGHLAFTMSFDTAYILPMIVGKITARILALWGAYFLYGKSSTDNSRFRVHNLKETSYV